MVEDMAAINFDQIANLSILRQFYHLAWRLFGVNVALVSPDGKRSLCLGSEETLNHFCVQLHNQHGCKQRCLACDRAHLAVVSKHPRALRYRCWAGLRDFIIPIMLDGEILAFLQCGQVLDAAPTDDDWRRTEIALRSADVTDPLLRRVFSSTRVVAPQTQEDLVALLELFGNYIAHAQQQLLLAQAPRQSQIIERALSYIRNHFAEVISLDDVARAAYTSKRNLTRVFREECGASVLNTIHGIRIAHACTLLYGTDMTCIQIALECGFGSVQQFNRTFVKLKHCTPQCWRKRTQGSSAKRRSADGLSLCLMHSESQSSHNGPSPAT
jgi:AraC-like DNA-binding protein/ligand-binding sensor protein